MMFADQVTVSFPFQPPTLPSMGIRARRATEKSKAEGSGETNILIKGLIIE